MLENLFKKGDIIIEALAPKPRIMAIQVSETEFVWVDDPLDEWSRGWLAKQILPDFKGQERIIAKAEMGAWHRQNLIWRVMLANGSTHLCERERDYTMLDWIEKVAQKQGAPIIEIDDVESASFDQLSVIQRIQLAKNLAGNL